MPGSIDNTSTFSEIITSVLTLDVPKLTSPLPNSVVQEICSIPLSDHARADKLVWGLILDGNFSTKLAGWLARRVVRSWSTKYKLQLDFEHGCPAKN